MHDPDPLLSRDAGGKPLVDLEHLGNIAGGRLLELRAPTLQLPLDVPLAACEVAQSDGVHVQVVQAGEHPDQRLTHAPQQGRIEGRGVLEGAHDHALDELHDVEGRPVDRLVPTQADDARNRYAAVGEGADDPVLPRHVVGGGKDVAEGRPAQDPVASGLVRHGEGEVGAATDDLLEGQRPGDADVLLEPVLQIRCIHALRRWSTGHGGER